MFWNCSRAFGGRSHCVRAVFEQQVLVHGAGDGQHRIALRALTIEFEELFLRAPSSDTGSKIFLVTEGA